MAKELKMEDVDIAAIEQQLAKLPFVQWDRFTRADFDGAPVILYGWIERELDAYKDFVLLELDPLGEVQAVTTSSAKHSAEISKILFGDEEDHNECVRVEEWFKIPNSIKI